MQAKQQSQVEMGLSSVTTMLYDISTDTIEGNIILESILKGFKNFETKMETSIFSVLNNEWVKNFDNFFKTENKSLKVLKSINDNLEDMFIWFMDEKKLIKNNNESPQIIKQTINNVSEINPNVVPTTVPTTIPTIPVKPIKTDNKKSLGDLKDSVKDAKEHIKGAIDYKGLVELIMSMVKNLNKKLYKKMNDFAEALSKFLTFDETKVDKFNTGIGKLTEIIDKLDKHLGPVGKSMLLFSTSFIVLGLAVINPLLPLGILILGKFLKTITSALDKKTLPKDIRDFSIGIGILTLAMFGMAFVPFSGMFKMLSFIYLLGFALRSHLGGSLSKGMIEFGAGIGILTLAMFAMSFVPISAMFEMLLFIGGLGFVLRAFTGVSGTPPLFKFALGMGLMVLALLAFTEVPIIAMEKMLGFILVLGLEMALINKIGGGGAMRGLPGFAFGLGLMVLAMFAMNELQLEAMFKTILFIGALGLVLKLFNAGSGLNMLMISGGILLLSASLWVFKQTGFTINDGLILGGTLIGLAAILVLMGPLSEFIILGSISLGIMSIAITLFSLTLALISKLKIKTESITTFMYSVSLISIGFALITPIIISGLLGATLFIPIAVSALLGGLTLALISVLKFNPMTIIDFMLSVGLLTAGFALIALTAIPGAIGALLFIPITVSALIAGLTLALISTLIIKTSTVIDFMLSVGLLTAGFALIVIPAAAGVIGAALFLPIASAGLLGALALSAISNIKLNPKSISDFGVSMGLLIDSFKSISGIGAAKAALKSAALLPIIGVATLAANLFNKIDNIDVNSARVGLLSMIDTLSIVMNKLETWQNKNSFKSIASITLLGLALKSFGDSEFKGAANLMDKFINNLSDDKKWDSINKHMVTLADNVKQIVTNVNMLNLEKAVALERNLKILSSKDSSSNLKDVIEKLKEMIGLLYENQQRQATQLIQATKEQSTVPGVDPKFSLIQPKDKVNEFFDPHDNGEVEPFTNLLDALQASILNVRIVNSNGTNKIDWKNGQ